MANSKVIVTQGTGTNLATSEITEGAEQRHLSRVAAQTSAGVDVDFATETTLASVNTKLTEGQDTMANSIPVVIASNQTAIPVSGTVTANLGTIAGAATETTLAALNTKVPSNLTVTATRLLTDIGTNGTVAINAAIPAGTNNIGDVDIVTMPAITGTVTANAGTNLNTSALALETTQNAIKTAVEIIDNAIAGNEMQVDVVAPLPTGTNSIGQVTANIGNTIFIQSTNNSSTAQLAAGATFTGVIENLITGRSMLVSLRVDQPTTINIIQYIDAAGTQAVGTTTFTRLANVPLNEAIQINGNYVRVTVQNTGASTTTNLVLDSWYGDMQPMPTSLTNSGNLKVAIAEGSARNKQGQYAISSFRTLGTAATPQNIFTMENSVGATRKIAIKKLTIIFDSTALLATVSPSIKLSRPAALPTGGTTLTAVKWDTTNPNAVAIVRGGTASDGGAATAITATAGAAIISVLVDRQATVAGFVTHREYDLLEEIGLSEPLILNANESILIQGVLANAATTHFVFNCIWEEYI